MKSIERLKEIEDMDFRRITGFGRNSLLSERKGILLALEDVRELYNDFKDKVILESYFYLRLEKLLKQLENFK